MSKTCKTTLASTVGGCRFTDALINHYASLYMRLGLIMVA